MAGYALYEALSQRGAYGDWELPECDGQQAVDADSKLADAMFISTERTSRLRVWRNHQALVVPRTFARQPLFFEAAKRASAPIVIRRSGGSAVMNGPHILNISSVSIIAKAVPVNIPDAYATLGKVIVSALNDIGVNAAINEVKGSHCPGRFSIVADGRKLAGTAAFVVSKEAERAVVAHANLYLESRKSDLEEIVHFERSLEMYSDYKFEAHIGLNQLAWSKRAFLK